MSQLHDRMRIVACSEDEERRRRREVLGKELKRTGWSLDGREAGVACAKGF